MGLRENFPLGLFLLFLTLLFPAAGFADDTFVIDYNAGTGANGALFRVDPVTGARTLLSDFGSGAPFGVNPNGVAVFRQSDPPSVLTMNEWGMMIFMALAGLGSVYYLRRQRRA